MCYDMRAKMITLADTCIVANGFLFYDAKRCCAYWQSILESPTVRTSRISPRQQKGWWYWSRDSQPQQLRGKMCNGWLLSVTAILYSKTVVYVALYTINLCRRSRIYVKV